MSVLNPDGAPVITLGGESFPIPMLAARQNRIIDPLILGLMPFMATVQRDVMAGMAALKEKDYDALQEVCFCAATAGRPGLTKEAFLDLPISLPELIAAFPVIAQQTGIFVKSGAALKPGEASAGNSQTGTAS